MIHCPSCGKQNESDWDSCAACQKDLVRVRNLAQSDNKCQKCGHLLDRYWEFCPGCGEKAAIEKPAEKPENTTNTDFEGLSKETISALINQPGTVSSQLQSRQQSFFQKSQRWAIIFALMAGLLAVGYGYVVFSKGMSAAYNVRFKTDLQKIKTDVRRIAATNEPVEEMQGNPGSRAVTELKAVQAQILKVEADLKKIKPSSELKSSHEKMVYVTAKYKSIVGTLIDSFTKNNIGQYWKAVNELDEVELLPLE